MKSRDERLKANWGTICTLKTGKSAISSEKASDYLLPDDEKITQNR